MPRRRIPLEESYRVNGRTGCWEWTRCIAKRSPNGNRYAAISAGNAHRWVYEQLVGPIPKGMHLDHLCFNTICVNPGHMEIVTPAENKRRANERRGRGQYATHCPKGHAYDDENTIRRADGGRGCRACSREASRRWKAKNRGRVRAYQRAWGEKNPEARREASRRWKAKNQRAWRAARRSSR